MAAIHKYGRETSKSRELGVGSSLARAICGVEQDDVWSWNYVPVSHLPVLGLLYLACASFNFNIRRRGAIKNNVGATSAQDDKAA